MLTETYIKQILSINAPYSYGHEQRINTTFNNQLRDLSEISRGGRRVGILNLGSEMKWNGSEIF